MTHLIHTQDTGNRVNFAQAPAPEQIDALIRHGYRYDEKARQWWQRGQKGVAQDAGSFFAWLESQPSKASTSDQHRYRFQSYYTPEEVAHYLVEQAQVQPGMTCLEPSAGLGAIAQPLIEAGGLVTCVEVDAEAAAELPADVLDVVSADFLSVALGDLGQFDRVVMNPPFSRDQDCRHVCHAFRFLKPGGRLVAIVGHYAVQGTRNPDRDRFRALMREKGRVIRDLPAGTFENNARCVVIEITA